MINLTWFTTVSNFSNVTAIPRSMVYIQFIGLQLSIKRFTRHASKTSIIQKRRHTRNIKFEAATITLRVEFCCHSCHHIIWWTGYVDLLKVTDIHAVSQQRIWRVPNKTLIWKDETISLFSLVSVLLIHLELLIFAHT